MSSITTCIPSILPKEPNYEIKTEPEDHPVLDLCPKTSEEYRNLKPIEMLLYACQSKLSDSSETSNTHTNSYYNNTKFDSPSRASSKDHPTRVKGKPTKVMNKDSLGVYVDSRNGVHNNQVTTRKPSVTSGEYTNYKPIEKLPRATNAHSQFSGHSDVPNTDTNSDYTKLKFFRPFQAFPKNPLAVITGMATNFQNMDSFRDDVHSRSRASSKDHPTRVKGMPTNVMNKDSLGVYVDSRNGIHNNQVTTRKPSLTSEEYTNHKPIEKLPRATNAHSQFSGHSEIPNTNTVSNHIKLKFVQPLQTFPKNPLAMTTGMVANFQNMDSLGGDIHFRNRASSKDHPTRVKELPTNVMNKDSLGVYVDSRNGVQNNQVTTRKPSLTSEEYTNHKPIEKLPCATNAHSQFSDHSEVPNTGMDSNHTKLKFVRPFKAFPQNPLAVITGMAANFQNMHSLRDDVHFRNRVMFRDNQLSCTSKPPLAGEEQMDHQPIEELPSATNQISNIDVLSVKARDTDLNHTKLKVVQPFPNSMMRGMPTSILHKDPSEAYVGFRNRAMFHGNQLPTSKPPSTQKDHLYCKPTEIASCTSHSQSKFSNSSGSSNADPYSNRTMTEAVPPLNAFPNGLPDIAMIQTICENMNKASLQAYARYRNEKMSLLSTITTNKKMSRPQYSTPSTDPEYLERRKKNNEAARKSRDARKAKEDEIAIRCAFLEQENMQLKYHLTAVEEDIKRFRGLLKRS